MTAEEMFCVGCCLECLRCTLSLIAVPTPECRLTAASSMRCSWSLNTWRLSSFIPGVNDHSDLRREGR